MTEYAEKTPEEKRAALVAHFLQRGYDQETAEAMADIVLEEANSKDEHET